MNRNYQVELEQIIKKENYGNLPVEEKPTLLLHSCCAPCSSYCMEYLRRFFRITILYFNPNITNREEYEHRVSEQKKLIDAYNRIKIATIYIDQKGNEISKASWNQKEDIYLPLGEQRLIQQKEVLLTPVEFLEGRYEPKEFFEIAKGYEESKEGTERCFRCYRLRLTETAKVAKSHDFDYFTTTLTISPLKNAKKLNEIGEELGKEYGVSFLPSDFKKKNGYKRSIELSKEYHLYRQDYCGCSYSKAERMRQKREALHIRNYEFGKDTGMIKGWVSDERECAMWSANHFTMEMSLEEFEKVLLNNQKDWGDQAFVVENELGEACGFFCCNVNEKKEMYLKYILVSGEFRGKGFGQKLVKSALQYGEKELHARIARLTVFEVNTAARKCYEKIGFVQSPEVRDDFVFREENWKRIILIYDF